MGIQNRRARRDAQREDDPEEFASRTTDDRFELYRRQQRVRAQVLRDSLANLWVVFAGISIVMAWKLGGPARLAFGAALAAHSFVVGVFTRGSVPQWVTAGALGGAAVIVAWWFLVEYGSAGGQLWPFSSLFLLLVLLIRATIERAPAL